MDSRQKICQANAHQGCCYDLVANNCSLTKEGKQCRERCAPGTLSTVSPPLYSAAACNFRPSLTDCLGLQAGDGLPPCADCLPGYADVDLDPITLCTACDAGSYAGRGTTACAVCRRGQADTDMRADTPCAACSPGQERCGLLAIAGLPTRSYY